LKSTNRDIITFTQIEEKLKKIRTAEQKINLLATSQKEFKIVLRSLKEAVKMKVK
jgi:hypothetical protein